ncbi:sugar phosphate isomerase/epimerase family protein [Pseudonocardia nematodicida]|uniref:Sugar phosphate isomerase/epimerase family protein n=1 Tax=Pseudonocardia nematodicida TaxID=1206997 RepID=A0ABV1KGH4_9PSEU
MIGLSTYAYFWRISSAHPNPMTLPDMLGDAVALGAEVFQICDHPPLEQLDADGLSEVRALAERLGIALETGTRGVAPEHLRRHLEIARALGAPLVRSMITAEDARDLAGLPDRLREVLAEFADAGVRLALETYEQIATTDLVDVVTRTGHPSLGIVLDPGNCVARLEHPADVVRLTAPYVSNLHVKDFAFSRRGGWVGFTYAGARLGEGLLDYAAMVDAVRPAERGISQIVEHWLPWTDDLETTESLERDWARHNIDYLRSRNP